ncbi:MAG: GntP family permease [Paludibacter sp.]|nr:GntP family permease [Paludibacter sp.]
MDPLVVSLWVLGAILMIVILTSVVRMNAFAALFSVALVLAVFTLPSKNIIETLKDGFGGTMASIGFLIIPGAIIAVVLEKTGGAASIANYLISKTGHSKAATALGLTGFLAGIPIFCDSGFIILSGLAKSFSKKSGVALSFISIVLATSLYSVHCLVPIHPGVLAATDMLNVNVGTMVLFGVLFAIPAAIAAFFWTKWQTENAIEENSSFDSSPEEYNVEELPPVGLSLLPILVPLILIAIGALFNALDFKVTNLFVDVLIFISQPVIALFIGATCSFILLKEKTMESINQLLGNAIEKAGPILIITAAGGMFGMVIKETGTGVYIGELLSETGLGLAVPFLIALILKTAQGSSTVAVITATSFVVPMLPALGLSSEAGKMLTVLALGAGSMMVSHANDSYFWVVNRFSGIPVNTALKVYTPATVIMGLTVFALVFITSLFIL